MEDVPFDLRALRILEYDKNDPNWGALLQEKIEQAIAEVLAAPHQSVPAAFLEATPKRPAITLTGQEKEILEIRQDIERLRQQQRSQSSLVKPSIPATDARERIEEYVRAGAPEGFIVRRLVARGVPESWVRRYLDEVKERADLLPGELSSAETAALSDLKSDSSVKKNGDEKERGLRKKVVLKKKTAKKKAAKKKT